MQPVTGCRPVAINVGVKNWQEAIEFYEAVFGVGMPRHSRFEDPSGNRGVLWQNGG